MSLRLSVFFEPLADINEAKDLANAINTIFPGMAEYNEGSDSYDIDSYWPSYINYPSRYRYFTYAELLIHADWNDLLQ